MQEVTSKISKSFIFHKAILPVGMQRYVGSSAEKILYRSRLGQMG